MVIHKIPCPHTQIHTQSLHKNTHKHRDKIFPPQNCPQMCIFFPILLLIKNLIFLKLSQNFEVMLLLLNQCFRWVTKNCLLLLFGKNDITAKISYCWYGFYLFLSFYLLEDIYKHTHTQTHIHTFPMIFTQPIHLI